MNPDKFQRLRTGLRRVEVCQSCSHSLFGGNHNVSPGTFPYARSLGDAVFAFINWVFN
jgi:hypothetical protein